MKYILLFSVFASTCFAAMTPQERQLVSGLSSQNDELRRIVTDQDKQIEKFQTDGLFANQKIESLTANLKAAGNKEKEQLEDLATQQTKIHAMAKELDDAYFGWNKAKVEAQKWKVEAQKWKVEANQRRVERDIGLVFFAFAATGLVMVFSGQIIGWITRQFPMLTPYGIVLWIGLAVLTFLSAYGSGLGVLKLIASQL